MPLKRRIARIILWSIPVLAVLLQFVPRDRNRDNPPVVSDAPWDSPRTKELFLRACGDCHSNETLWPWYSAIAPISWMLEHDVAEGRARLNVSEYATRRYRGPQAAHKLKEGMMPPRLYVWAHGSSRLTNPEQQELLKGLEATFGRDQ